MAKQDTPESKALTYANITKRAVAFVLLVLMLVVVVIGTVELVVVIGRAILNSSGLTTSEFLLSEQGLLQIFGLFLNVLIALELIETVEVYFHESALHAETVILVALIAIARKAILLDLSYYEPATILGLAALTIALGVAYYLVKDRTTSKAAA